MLIKYNLVTILILSYLPNPLRGFNTYAMNISNYSYHPSNDTTPRATPSRSLTRAPTEGEIRSAILGPEKCPHLEDRGGFRVWDLNNLYRGVTIEPGDFNCFAWSVGHTDRWLEGGSVADMNDLCKSGLITSVRIIRLTRFSSR